MRDMRTLELLQPQHVGAHGCKAIGIEIEGRNCEIAADGLRQEVLAFERRGVAARGMQPLQG